MSQSVRKIYAAEEYLFLEETAQTRSEFYRGEIFLMAGGSANHNRISGNAYLTLRLALGNRNCEVFNSDIRLLAGARDFYTYADVTMVCGEVQFIPNRDDTITNPALIVEVLSPSTRNYDRGDKFQLYRAIESFHTYLIIEQNSVYLECYTRLNDGSWQLQTYNKLEQAVELVNLGITIQVSALYERVKFPDRPVRLPRERKTPHPQA